MRRLSNYNSMNNKEMNRFKMKFFILLTLTCMLCLPCYASGNQTQSENNSPIFLTPEDAITYYIEGIAENDVDKILSACAINERAERFRYDLFTQKSQEMQFYGTMAPSSYSFYVEMNKVHLINTRLHQIKLLSFGLLSHEKVDGYPISPVDSGRINNFILDVNPERLSTIKVEKIGFPFKHIADTQKYRKNAKTRAAYNGADESTERIVLFSFEQNFYYIGFSLLRYGQNWKIETQSSALGGAPASGIAEPITVHEFDKKINE